MSQTMSRGKQQVLYTYLPMNTIDFQGGSIARIVHIRGGNPDDEINPRFIVERIREDAEAWDEEFRPALRDSTLQNSGRFILVNPSEVSAELYPKVFWCDKCGRIRDLSESNTIPNSNICPKCRDGRLNQLRFVLIHRCGEIRPLVPPDCRNCHGVSEMALNTHGSERVSEFRWVCRRCNTTTRRVIGGLCPACEWPAETDEDRKELRRMRILVHRAGPTFYPRSVTQLNVPRRRLDSFFGLGEIWRALAAAKFLNLPELKAIRLEDITLNQDTGESEQSGLSGEDLDTILNQGATPELTAEQVLQEIRRLQNQRNQERKAHTPQVIAAQLVERSGIALDTWYRAGQELLEAVLPYETCQPQSLVGYDGSDTVRVEQHPKALQKSLQLGFKDVELLDDFPVVKSTYGYTRLESVPMQAGKYVTRLNAFPTQPNTDGKLPIFVDSVRADALMFRLNPTRVHRWLRLNGYTATFSEGTDKEVVDRAFFVQQFDGVALGETLPEGISRMVFCLIHTYSHVIVRQAGLLCGLDRTSLSEYLLPRALTMVLFCNHRFGATIGALTSLFEQSLVEWFDSFHDARRCVYDPVCRDRDGACHACLHLPETSCGHFNLNLGRAFLFGGNDHVSERPMIGYLDPILDD